jgi:hypothetical protein
MTKNQIPNSREVLSEESESETEVAQIGWRKYFSFRGTARYNAGFVAVQGGTRRGGVNILGA